MESDSVNDIHNLLDIADEVDTLDKLIKIVYHNNTKDLEFYQSLLTKSNNYLLSIKKNYNTIINN